MNNYGIESYDLLNQHGFPQHKWKNILLIIFKIFPLFFSTSQMEKYFWDLYSGKAAIKDLNCHWVRLQADIQGGANPLKIY
jgi:hypothetical protein